MDVAESTIVEGQPVLLFQGRLELPDLIHIATYHEIVSGARDRRIGLLFGLTITLLCVAILLVPRGDLEWIMPKDRAYVVITLVLSMFWLYFLVVSPFMRRSRVRNTYESNPEGYLETKVILKEDKIIVENADFYSRFSWRCIATVADTREGLMFCNSESSPGPTH